MKYRFEDIAINSTIKKKPEESDKYYYIGLEHLVPGNLFVQKYGSEVAPIGEKLVMKKGDVLFGKRRAYQKKVAIAPCDGIFSAHGMVLRPNEAVINKEYFPFFISSDIFLNEAVRISVGSLSPTINWRDLKELEFDLPPIKQQERLAKLLWAAYELKESYKKLIVVTDEMVKTQFIDVMKNSHSHKSFNELFEYISRGKSPQYVDSSNVLVLNQACIYWEKIRWENVKYQDPDKLANKRVLENGDLLLNSTGTGTLGRCVVYNNPLDKNKYVADGHVTTIKVNQSVLLPDIFCMYLSLADTQKEIYINCVRGSTNQIELSKEKLLLLDMPLISIDKQDEFLSIKRQADKSKTELQQSIERIDKVIKSLLP